MQRERNTLQAIIRPHFPTEMIDVWCVRTEASDAAVEEFRLALTFEERERAARFRFDHLQRSFVLARGALRVLLGSYLNTSRSNVRFRYNSSGKPSLASLGRIRFNVSHSSRLAVFAFTLDCEVGVDVEKIRPLQEMDEIAKHFFCAEEAAELAALPLDERERAFFLCWTRKEAYIKATGDGLSAPLGAFRVTLRPCDVARFIHLPRERGSNTAWTLDNLKLSSDYAGALAYADSQRLLNLLPTVDVTELLAIS